MFDKMKNNEPLTAVLQDLSRFIGKRGVRASMTVRTMEQTDKNINK